MKHIIIPACETTPKCREYLDNCLDSIKRGGYYENGYHTIIAYDNCSEEFQDYFKNKYKGDFIVAIDNKNPKNLNFCKNANSGLKIAYQAAVSTGDIDAHFIILNMDTILPHHTILDLTLGEGLSSPTPVDNPVIQAGPYSIGTSPRVPVLRFGGFCICMSYKLVDTIGFLDERFTASFEDDDVCARAALAGFPVELVGTQVHHELKDRTTPSNTGAYDNASLGLHLEIFRRKWSIPHYIQHEQFNNWIVDNHKWIPEMRCE